MSYLTSYRNQSAKYGGYQEKAFKLPDPYKPKTTPQGANDNAPKPANDNVKKTVRNAARLLRLSRKGALLARANPYVQAALFAWDIWDLAHPTAGGQDQAMVRDPGLAAQGFSLWTSCPGNTGGVVGWRPGTGSPGVGTFTCLGNQGSNGCLRPNETTNYTVTFFCDVEQHINNVGYPWGYSVKNHDTYKRAVGSPGYTPFRWYKLNPTERPLWGPLSPELLPIKQPMPLPLPIPYALVPHRLNDPLGSQRTNGEPRIRFVPRRPPTRGKEKKLGALAPVFFALQKIHHSVTEGLDLLDALHDALPKSYQAKAGRNAEGRWHKATPQDKARALYNNFDKVDWNEAIKNLIVNHVTDEIIGRAAGGAKRGLDKTPVGRIVGGGAIFNPH